MARLFRILFVAAAAGSLWACGGGSALDDLDDLSPTGTAFQRSLYQNYAYLARSLSGKIPGVASRSFEDSGWFGGGRSDDAVAQIAESFAAKAAIAAGGRDVSPERPPSGYAEGEEAYKRLQDAFAAGARERAPVDAARAQADYDCWIVNRRVPVQAAAAAQCQSSFAGSMRTVERQVGTGTEIVPVQPVAQAPAAAELTVYFGFDEWTLTAEALQVITSAIDTARRGGHQRINVVGHTDTSGSREYNLGLSERRANVVRQVLIEMGARPEAVFAAGVGENDLAVPTGDGVREPRNRRSVISLVP